MRRSLIAAIVAVFALCSVSHAEKLTILTGEWFPYVSESIDEYGFAAEVVSSAFASVGIEAQFEFAPWPRCQSMIRNGKSFGAFPYIQTPKRKNFAIFSDPIAESRSVFFCLKNGRFKKHGFSTLAELRPYKIQAAKGYFYYKLFSKYELDVQYNLLVDYSFKKMNLGWGDLVPEDELVGWALIQKMFPGEKYRFRSSRAFSIDNLHIMVSKKYPGSDVLLKLFNTGLATIKQNGLYLQLQEKYHGDMQVTKKDDIFYRYSFRAR